MKAIKLALHWQMGIALILGATLGIIFCDSYSAWGNVIMSFQTFCTNNC